MPMKIVSERFGLARGTTYNFDCERGQMKRGLSAFLFFLITIPFAIPQEHPSASVQPRDAVQKSAEGERLWAELIEGNQRFVSGQTKPRELIQLRHSLAQGQHPRVIVLACSDSRVAPELLFDRNLGDLFVIRAAGNIADPIEVGSIEYAVEHLGSSLLVVLGHEKCGAVTAACSGERMPTANLQAIVDKISPAVIKAKTYAKPEALLDAAIRENVHQSARDVLASSEVLRHAHEEGKLAVIESFYTLDSGEVVRLTSSVDLP
jgi:carbonic anhydrase